MMIVSSGPFEDDVEDATELVEDDGVVARVAVWSMTCVSSRVGEVMLVSLPINGPG